MAKEQPIDGIPAAIPRSVELNRRYLVLTRDSPADPFRLDPDNYKTTQAIPGGFHHQTNIRPILVEDTVAWADGWMSPDKMVALILYQDIAVVVETKAQATDAVKIQVGRGQET